jgi:outer membrane protein assembly factor BamD (BamD/ComL family)
MKRITPSALLAMTLALSLSACASVPDSASIAPEMTVGELSQKGQAALDDNNYKAAEVYYQTIINRYGTDTGTLTAAEFEIAHLRMKQKNWTDAKTRLETIIARYESTGGAGLPPEYLVLAKNDIARIPETGVKTAQTAKAVEKQAETPAATDTTAK